MKIISGLKLVSINFELTKKIDREGIRMADLYP